MDRVTLLTAMTRATSCPSCGERRLEFLLRCDLQYGACLYTAHCRACDDSFEIVAGPAPPEAALPEAAEPCPGCGGRERRASLHCEVASHTCVYTLECPRCAPAP